MSPENPSRSSSRGRNLTWHQGTVDRRQREELLGQQGAVLWFTGLSGSGKSTVACALETALHSLQRPAYRLDGDNVRHGLCRDLGFSKQDRDENIRRVAEASRLFLDAGLICLTSFISPFREERRKAREIVGSGFLEVYVSAPLAVCESRDPKGLYRKAREGAISDFTGISSPYEAPESPELTVDTSSLTLDEAVEECLALLRQRKIIPG